MIKMYETFYGFHLKPFELTPDPKFLYISAGLREILASLEYGIIQKRGFMLLIGEPGTGKTTLINSLMQKIDIDADYAYIFNPDLNFYELLHTVLINLNLASVEEELSKTKAMHRLNSFALNQFEKNRNTVIIVDEAQTLDIKTLEALRLLSNFETHSHKLLQIIISGQPELKETLNSPRLTQLSQRFGLRCRTVNFSERETYEYITYRLKVAGCIDSQLFSNKAKQLIWSYTGGNPRIINIVCDNSLLAGYASEQKRINSLIVKEAIDDLKEVPLSRIDYPDDSFREIEVEKYQTLFDEPDKMNLDSSTLSENKDKLTNDVINSDRHQLIQEEAELREEKEGIFSFTKISLIAAVVSILAFFIVYVFVGNFTGLKKESSSRLEVRKTIVHNKAIIEKEEQTVPSLTEPSMELDIDDEAKIQDDDKKIITEAKSDSEYNLSGISSNVDNTKIHDWVRVKKGETLGTIMLRIYGKADPKIITAILKINPDVKDPNHIIENQILKLPQKSDLD